MKKVDVTEHILFQHDVNCPLEVKKVLNQLR